MNLHFRKCAYLLAVAICVSCVAVGKSQEPQRTLNSGSISGYITVDGKPKAGVVVELIKVDDANSRKRIAKTTTSKSGRYVFRDVLAGRYDIYPDTPKLVVPNDGSGGNLGKSVAIESGETVRGINLDLVSQGSISGRVIDNTGRPVSGQAVEWLLKRDDGTVLAVNIPEPDGRTTNDDGMYRVVQVPPGRYVVKVGIPYGLTLHAWKKEGSVDYRETFHPDVNDESKADAVEVKANGETTNVDIVVGQPLRTYTITGRVVDDSGQLAPNVWLGIKTKSEDGRSTTDSSGLCRSDANGEFRIKGAMPGEYAVYPEADADANLYGEPVLFELKDEDITGLKIDVHAAASIIGVAIVDGPVNTSTNGTPIQILAQSLTNERPQVGHYSTIDSEGRFRVSGLRPGRVTFIANTESPDAPQGLKVVRIERDGRPLSEGLDVGAGETISGIKLTLRAGSGTLRGDLAIEGGTLEGVKLLIGYRLTTGDPHKYFSVEADARGHFVIQQLIAGEYEIFIGPSTVYISGEAGSRNFSRMPTVKQFVTIAPGAEAYLKLVVPLEPLPVQ